VQLVPQQKEGKGQSEALTMHSTAQSLCTMCCIAACADYTGLIQQSLGYSTADVSSQIAWNSKRKSQITACLVTRAPRSICLW
jgi:hypothetical protein